jgi:hypothetical protein
MRRKLARLSDPFDSWFSRNDRGRIGGEPISRGREPPHYSLATSTKKGKPMRVTPLLHAIVVGTIILVAQHAFAGESDTFTYQGRLLDNGTPVNGPHQIEFRLFDALSGGNEIAAFGPATYQITGGLLNADVDFGPGAFDGEPRWLEIAVDGVTLSPRQLLNANPYALFARNAPFRTSGSSVYYADGHVGIGTDAPESPLHVEGRIRSAGDGAAVTVYNPQNAGASVNLNWLNNVARIRVAGNGLGADAG